MKRIMSPIILGIVYVIMLINVFFGSSILFYDSEDILKLLIIIIINIIDIMIPIVSRVIFNVDNKKVISFPKVILNIFMILTTIVWWGEVKYDHLSRTAALCYFFIMLWIILRILLAIIEVIMLVPEKQIKSDSNEKNTNLIIKPVIQLIGYMILIIAIFADSSLAIFMPIIMFIIDIIMLATSKKNINLIKFMISVIMIFTTMGLVILTTELLDFIILESILQIILNLIEIITISPILRRNIKKISIVTLSIVIVCIIGVNVNTVKLKYNIYQRTINYYYGINSSKEDATIITSKDEFEEFIDNKIKLIEEQIYKRDSFVKEEIDRLETYKQNVISELEIDEQFFDKYNVIYGIYHKGINAGSPRSIRSVKYNRIKDKIFIEHEVSSGYGTMDSAYYEYFIKIDKKYDAQVEWKGVSGIFF